MEGTWSSPGSLLDLPLLSPSQGLSTCCFLSPWNVLFQMYPYSLFQIGFLQSFTSPFFWIWLSITLFDFIFLHYNYVKSHLFGSHYLERTTWFTRFPQSLKWSVAGVDGPQVPIVNKRQNKGLPFGLNDLTVAFPHNGKYTAYLEIKPELYLHPLVSPLYLLPLVF